MPRGEGPESSQDDSRRLDAIEAVIESFEVAWKSGPPGIDGIRTFLGRHADRSATLLRELVAIDLENRLKRGETARVEEYLSPFPDLESDPEALADLLLHEWRLRCRTDPALGIDDYRRRFGQRRGVCEALEAARPTREAAAATGDFVSGAAAAAEPAADALLGADIQGIRLVRLIAEGGMGRVYEGRQEKPRRPVAVKVIKPGLTSPSLLRRFDYEAQVLGRLRHPGIAQIFMVGTHDVGGTSSPYFVMEYIPNAKTLTRYADEQQLTTHQRLELFRRVCDAVAHGHQKGVIHRDLKPGNVLVDSSGQPKVIDFGVARCTDSDMALTTMQTDVGALIGTLQYMSPEQFDADPHDLDVRLDVYALGVILYELLAGRPPYDVRRRAVYEVARVVREEDPTPISTLNKTLRRDVAIIAGTCLQKDRSRRYSSAAELAADVSRYLAGLPITAAPPSFFDAVTRLARRHKAAAAAVAGVVASLVAAVIGISIFAVRADRARRDADVQRVAATRAQAAEADQRVVAETQAAIAEERSREAETQRQYKEMVAYKAQLDLVESAYRFQNQLKTALHLDACQWDLRDWEYRHLLKKIGGHPVLLGHTAPVRSVAVSGDGGLIASAGDDGVIRLWQAESGVGAGMVKIGSRISCIAWHPHEHRLLVGRVDGTAQVWDVDQGVPAAVIAGLGGPVLAVAWRSDGQQVMACVPQAIVLCRADDGGRERHIEGGPDEFAAAAYSPDGSRVVSAGMPAGQPRRGPEGWKKGGGKRTTIRVWDAAKGEQVLTIPDLQGEPTTIAFSPDGRSILSSTFDWHGQFFGVAEGSCQLRTWDADTGREGVLFVGHSKPLLAAAYSPDGTKIASANGGTDNSIRLWDAATGKEIRPAWPSLAKFKGVRAPINSIAFTRDGSRLVTGSDDAEVRLWTVAGDWRPRILETGAARAADGSTQATRVNCITFTPDGLHIATGDGYPQQDRQPGMIEIWESNSGRRVGRLAGHASLVWDVDFSPDGAVLASVGSDGTLRLWDWRNERQLASYRGSYECVAFSPDGRMVAVGAGGVLDLRSAETGEVIRSVRLSGATCRDVAFRPDGRELAAASDADIAIHDAMSGDEVAILRGHSQPVWAVAYAADGGALATVAGSRDESSKPGELKLWDVATRRERFGTGVEGGAVSGVVWTPDGRRVVTGGMDRAISVWDARFGLLVGRAEDDSIILSMAVSPDGHTIACGTHRGALLFDALDGEDCRILRSTLPTVDAAWFTADGSRIVAVDDRGKTQAWSATTGQAVASPDGVDPPSQADDPQVRFRGLRPLVAAHAPVRHGTGTTVPRIADVDRDGRPDLLVAAEGRVWWYRARQDREFDAAAPLPLAEESTAATGGRLAIAWCDLDGDTVPDLVTVADRDRIPRACMNDTVPGGPPRFAEPKPLQAHGGGDVVAADIRVDVGDVDGDGVPDMVTGSVAGDALVARGRRTTSGGVTFAEALPAFSDDGRGISGAYNLNLRALDYDGDGLCDLVESYNWGTITIRPNTGKARSPRFPVGAPLMATGADGEALELHGLCDGAIVDCGDLDLDGTPDIVLGGEKNGVVLIGWGQSQEEVMGPVPTLKKRYPALSTVSPDGRWTVAPRGTIILVRPVPKRE